MTPLEELQAAHKRLSELREVGPSWTARHEDGEVMAGPYFVASTAADEYTELIVTLHRTIDAQLSLLDVAYGTLYDDGNRRGTFLVTEALCLARAINGY